MSVSPSVPPNRPHRLLATTRAASHGPPGPWTTAADVLVAVLVALAALTWYYGGFRERIGDLRLSVTSWPRLLLVAAILTAVRHGVRPRPSLPLRLWRWGRALAAGEAGRASLSAWVTTRISVLLVGYFAVITIGIPPGAARFTTSPHVLANLPARWDAGWYLNIATEGYEWSDNLRRQHNVAFFPALPVAMRVLAPPLGHEYMLAGTLVSLAAFCGALFYVFRFARERYGPEAAGAAVWLLATYPFAVFYSVPYTEALFLLAIAGACWHFERGQPAAAGLWGVLAGLTRPNGMLLAIPLLVLLAGRAWRTRRMRLSDAAAALAPIAGLLVYMTYLWARFDEPLAWLEAHGAWGRGVQSGWMAGAAALVADRWTALTGLGLYEYSLRDPIDVLNGSAAVFVLVLTWPIARRLGIAYAALVLVILLPALLSGGTLSAGRITAPLFPVFVWLGATVPAWQRPAWIAGFAMLQALVAALFFTWRPAF